MNYLMPGQGKFVKLIVLSNDVNHGYKVDTNYQYINLDLDVLSR